jgi:hypothetical protein
LRKAPGGFTHVLDAIDKFSKWVEVHPITNLRAEQAVTFFTDIVYRFGVPNSIITDNGSQFTGRKFLEFCDKFHIRVDWAAVAHPQTNGQVERANGMILKGLKPRIFDRLNKSGRKWLQELPVVVWSLRTTLSKATRFTPFFLVYGAEAILPTDLEYGSPRVRGLDARLHLLGCTERKQYQSCTHDRSRLEHRRCRLKQTPHTLVRLAKNHFRSTHAPVGLRGLDLRVR